MSNTLAALGAIAASLPLLFAVAPDHPNAEITNGLIRARTYLPDLQTGFYRGTRFDWSGVLYSLERSGHNYYGPWFDRTDTSVRDFIYKGDHIIAGPCSAITGPVDEFAPIGYDEARPGGTFVKIGIGALTKPSEDKYDNYRLYDIANAGEWRVTKHSDAIEFVQTLDDSKSGYGYRYQKNVRLTSGKAQMLLEHRLKNIGKRAINTTVYNHNFLVLDHQPPGPGVTIAVPFTIRTPHPPQNNFAEIHGHEISYVKKLQDRDMFATPLEGFGENADHNVVQIENRSVGAGIRWRTDRPLFSEFLWSIRTVVAMEPFISIAVAPGAEFTWTTVYDYYAVPHDSK
jgi:hypothetical protein